MFGRPGELVSAILGGATGRLVYPVARFTGAVASGLGEPGRRWRVFVAYLKGTMTEDNRYGAAMAIDLAWGNAFAGSELTIRDLIDPAFLENLKERGAVF